MQPGCTPRVGPAQIGAELGVSWTAVGDHVGVPASPCVGCLHITDLDKIDLTVLEAIIAESYRTVTADTYTRRAREGAP